MEKSTVNHRIDTVIRRKVQNSGAIKSRSEDVLQEVSKIRKDTSSFFNINLSLKRSLKDFKEFKKNKSSKQNSSNEVVEYYNSNLDSLCDNLDFHFKKIPLYKASDELRNISTDIYFNGNRFEKKDQDQFVKGSIIRIISSLNTLLEEEEIEKNILSVLSDINIRSSHKTDEILLVFSLKNNDNDIETNVDIKKIISSLKTIVFRLRDLGNVVSASFLKKKDNSFLKIVGSDGIRESIADISIELKPGSFFEKNPEQTFVLCRRFEQLLGYNLDKKDNNKDKDKDGNITRNKTKNKNKSKKKETQNYILWDLNCRYGLLTLSALRLGWSTFSVITSDSSVDDIYNNININKGISDPIINKKSDYIISSSDIANISVPKDRLSPQVIVLRIDERFKLSESFIQLLVASMSQKKYSRLFLYTFSINSLKEMSLKLKDYGIILRQVEGTEIIPNDKNQICYLSIFSKRLKQK